MPSLQALCLPNNLITNCKPLIKSHWPNLNYLDLSENKIAAFNVGRVKTPKFISFETDFWMIFSSKDKKDPTIENLSFLSKL